MICGCSTPPWRSCVKRRETWRRGALSMTSEPFAVVAAYQRLRLREIRSLYDELDRDLEHYLGVEHRISKELDSLEGESAEIRKTLLSLGADLRAPEAAIGPAR